MEACEPVGVPYIPAVKVAELRTDDYRRFDRPTKEQYDRLASALAAVYEAHEPNHMVRLDYCAGWGIKYAMDRRPSHGWDEDFGYIVLDDPRAYDINSEWPRETVPVWKRPWVIAQMHLGYPVEYRAFVRDGSLQGISSYHPQRPLPKWDEHIDAITEYTERPIDAMPTPFQWHYHMFLDSDISQDGVHFTADYLVQQDGQMVFLEGGLPFGLGAHPRCFSNGEIAGIALSLQT